MTTDEHPDPDLIAKWWPLLQAALGVDVETWQAAIAQIDHLHREHEIWSSAFEVAVGAAEAFTNHPNAVVVVAPLPETADLAKAQKEARAWRAEADRMRDELKKYRGLKDKSIAAPLGFAIEWDG
jgi:hypothetical protein